MPKIPYRPPLRFSFSGRELIPYRSIPEFYSLKVNLRRTEHFSSDAQCLKNHITLDFHRNAMGMVSKVHKFRWVRCSFTSRVQILIRRSSFEAISPSGAIKILHVSDARKVCWNFKNSYPLNRSSDWVKVRNFSFWTFFVKGPIPNFARFSMFGAVHEIYSIKTIWA